MATVFIPAETKHFYLDEIAHLIADSKEPEGPNDPDSVRYWLTHIQAMVELETAAHNGVLNVRHPMTYGPFPMELGLKRAVVLLRDAREYLADRDIAVEVEAPAPASEAGQGAPVAEPGKRWTPENLAKLKAYREAHTMPETAAEFGITEQRIRQLLPSKKPRPTPFAGLVHRMK